MRRISKRGFEMAIGTIIIIVLAVFVMIGILFVWNYQTGIFSDILGNINSRSNVDTIILACNNFVNQQNEYEYCCVERNVKLDDTQKFELTCDELRNQNFSSGKINLFDCRGGC